MSFLLACMMTCMTGAEMPPKEIWVGVSYFAGWWEETPNKWMDPNGKDWRARYPERAPLLGEYNTQDTMDREIIAAARNGIDFFSILWYYLEPGKKQEPHVEQVNRGLANFMASPESHRMKFMVECCNHPPFEVLADAQWDECIQTFLKAFAHPSYLRLNGKPVFKIHSGHFFYQQCGNDWQKGQARLETLRDAVRHAGLGEVLIGVGVGGYETIGPQHWAKQYFDFTGTYMDVPDPQKLPPQAQDYPYPQLASFIEEGRAMHFNDAVPYMPLVAAGWCPRPWDDPRAGYAFPSKREWTETLRKVKADLLAHPSLGLPGQKAFNIYAWNEFGEGGIVAPTRGDKEMKMNSIRKVFGKQ